MGKIKTFFHVLIQSHISPAYYKELLPVKFSFSLKYFYLYFFLYAIIGTIYAGVIAGPPVSKFISALPAKIQSLYPDELIVTIKDGEISTNVQEPFVIPISNIEDLFSPENVLGTSNASPENLVVIDTNGRAEDFTSYSTVVLITKKSVVAMDDNGTRLYPIGSDMNFTLTKTQVVEVVNKIKPVLNYFLPAMVAFVFLGLLIFGPSGHLVYLLFFALAFLILSKITKTGLTYKGCYKLGLHLITPYATVFGLLSLFKIYPHFPFLRTILLLIFGFFALRHMSPSPAPAPATTPPPQPANKSTN